MDGYQKRTEKKKAQIKQAAFTLFNKYGIEKVTMKDIADAANVSPVTIYKYFGNRDELLRTLSQDFLDQSYVFFKRLLEEEIPFTEKIDRLVDYSIRQKKMFNEDYFKKLYYGDPNYVRFTNEHYMKRVQDLMIELIRQGKDNGYVDPDLSDTSILLYTKAVIDAFTDKDTALAIDEATRVDLVNLYFYGLDGPRDKGNLNVRRK